MRARIFTRSDGKRSTTSRRHANARALISRASALEIIVARSSHLRRERARAREKESTPPKFVGNSSNLLISISSSREHRCSPQSNFNLVFVIRISRLLRSKSHKDRPESSSVRDSAAFVRHVTADTTLSTFKLITHPSNEKERERVCV